MMNVSKVQICNMALGKIGVTEQITSLNVTEGQATPPEVVQCNLFYPLALGVVTRSHNWKTLSARKALSANSTSPAFEYDYAFDLPADFERLIEVYESDSDWTREGNQILTDDSSCSIKYLASPVGTANFDALFIDALVTVLASYLATGIARDGELGLKLMQIYKSVLLPEGRFADSSEEDVTELETTEWLDSRA